MKVLIINGPNLNRLGFRNPELYGNRSFEDYLQDLRQHFPDLKLQYFQSNHEGALIDFLQEESGTADGIVINGGGLSHTSISLADALVDTGLPAVELHISDVYAREPFRHHSFLKAVCLQQISGEGLKGYSLALEILIANRRAG